MKLLLDENLPKRLKHDFPGHLLFTVFEMGWTGRKNGELLALMISEGFDALLTFDKNLKYQQNFRKYQLPVLVLNAEDNSYLVLSTLVPKIIDKLNSGLQPGSIEVK
jgi:predicted nuclease of predicted toxin-antitoxin system